MMHTVSFFSADTAWRIEDGGMRFFCLASDVPVRYACGYVPDSRLFGKQVA